MNEEETVPLSVAEEEVEIVSRRLALLHLSYAKTLFEEFGGEEGRKLVLKAIKDYGSKIGEKTSEEVKEQGLKPTPENFSKGKSLRVPKFGMHSKIEEIESGKVRAFGCALGRLWKEYGEEELGRLYCYVDPAKYTSYNPDYTQAHTKAIPEGDEFCELVIRPTTDGEKKLFSEEDEKWSKLDKPEKEE